MKWLDIGWEAHGVIAIGQFATGVLAIGQVAWGVVAIGQAAFGAVAIGQLAVGGATVGMVGVGLNGTIAMLGIGGRGLGFVLPLLPSLGLRKSPPVQRTLAEARAGRDDGWTRLRLVPKEGALVDVFDGPHRVDDVRIDARCRRASVAAAPGDVWAHLRAERKGDGLVVDQLLRIPRPRWTRPEWWLVWATQLTGLMLLSALVWWGVAEPVIEGLSAP